MSKKGRCALGGKEWSYITLTVLMILLKYLVIGTFQTPPRTWCGLHKCRFFHRRWILLALIENTWLLWSSQFSWRIASRHRRQPINVELGYLWVFPHLFPWFRPDCLNNSEIFSPLCIAVLVQENSISYFASPTRFPYMWWQLPIECLSHESENLLFLKAIFKYRNYRMAKPARHF